MAQTNTINVRQALAGLGLLQGKTLKSALTEDGNYAPSTAKSAKSNGHSAERLLDQAKHLTGVDLGAKIAATAREKLSAAVEAYEVGDLPLDRLARTVDVIEKWYGGRADKELNREPGDVTINQRITNVSVLILEAQQRGLVAPASGNRQYVNQLSPESEPASEPAQRPVIEATLEPSEGDDRPAEASEEPGGVLSF